MSSFELLCELTEKGDVNTVVEPVARRHKRSAVTTSMLDFDKLNRRNDDRIDRKPFSANKFQKLEVRAFYSSDFSSSGEIFELKYAIAAPATVHRTQATAMSGLSSTANPGKSE
jgi:hypothetical protein